MNKLATTALMPDGYQVINITTGEPVWHLEREILTWQLASQVLAANPANYHAIVAVTEAQMAADPEIGTPCYLPEYFSFCLGSTQAVGADGDYAMVAHSSVPDSAENELCLNPRITGSLIALLGLPMAPGPESKQKVWPLDLVRDRIAAVQERDRDCDVDIRKGFADLKWLVHQAGSYGSIDLLLLDCNSSDLWEIASQDGYAT